MKVICPRCSQVRDVTGMAPDSVVECECGQAFRVPKPVEAQTPPPIGPGGQMSSEIPLYTPPAARTEPAYRPTYSGPAAGYLPPTPGQAVASIILGIVSFFCCPIFTAIPGLILGYKAKNMIDDNPGMYGGRGAAVAGIVISWIGLALGFVWVIFIIFGGFLEVLGSF